MRICGNLRNSFLKNNYIFVWNLAQGHTEQGSGAVHVDSNYPHTSISVWLSFHQNKEAMEVQTRGQKVTFHSTIHIGIIFLTKIHCENAKIGKNIAQILNVILQRQQIEEQLRKKQRLLSGIPSWHPCPYLTRRCDMLGTSTSSQAWRQYWQWMDKSESSFMMQFYHCFLSQAGKHVVDSKSNYKCWWGLMIQNQSS